PAVAGDRGDVHAHQFSLVDAGIIFGFLALIRRVVRPFYEVPHSAGGAVAIEDLEPDLLFAQFRSDTLQSLRDRLQQVTARGVVSVDTLPDEVVAAGVADIGDHIRHEFRDVCESCFGDRLRWRQPWFSARGKSHGYDAGSGEQGEKGTYLTHSHPRG